MSKRLVAIAIIFCGASLAWVILGQTLFARTAESDSSQRASLGSQWGSAQAQAAPIVRAHFTKSDVAVPLHSSRINVHLNLEQRRKGLLWYNLYDVDYQSHYVVRNDTKSHDLTLHFQFPSADGSFRNVTYAIGGKRIDDAAAPTAGDVRFELTPGEETTIDIGYSSRGKDSWMYSFGPSVQSVRDFALTMTTNFDAIDFPPQTLLPVEERSLGKAWLLKWNYSSLITGDGIGMTFPTPMQPGPLAERITAWAPVALLFYFFVMLVITKLRNINIHPVNYFFLAAAFFAFHLLFAYLVDRVAVELAFVICSLVSIFLTVSYLRLVAGWRFAAVESGLAQLVYLVLFSYALFDEGWSGLAITVGAILTLFVVMQLTGKINWAESRPVLES